MLHLTLYLLENRDRIKDGQTIGVDANHKMPMHIRPSRYGAKGDVLRIGD
jgi:hypothetical protein